MSVRSFADNARPDVPPPALLSLNEAARRLGVSLLTVRAMLGNELTDRRIGRRRLVTTESLDRFVAGVAR